MQGRSLLLPSLLALAGCAGTVNESGGADALRQRDAGASDPAPSATGIIFGPIEDGSVQVHPACPWDAGSLRGGDAAAQVAGGAENLTVLVVFDKSTSMETPWDDRSRWQAASDAMIAGIAPYLTKLTVGAILFPQLGMCGVAPIEHPVQLPFTPGAEFVTAWLERACWPKNSWGTPLDLALQAADHAIGGARSRGMLERPFRVLVVTDGEPNCDDDPARLTALASSWLDLGIRTYVLGLPGSEGAAALLDSIALAGGTDKHQSPGTPREFQEQVAAAVQ